MGLPPLREELALHEAARMGDGQPAWTLHDPVRNQFFRIDWLGFEVLSRWSLDDPALISAAIHAASTLRPTQIDVEAVIQFMVDNQLVRAVGGGSAAGFAERLHKTRHSPLVWLLHHYLFFRVPLLRPDRWLTRWQGVAAFFFSPLFLWLTGLALVVGLVEVWRNWEPFVATLVETFSFKGLLAYGVTLSAVKVLHELGHAFTAKRHGCRVPTMGLAFLVLWPVAYTDTNEAWKLPQRRQRLAIDAAGVSVELLVAVWATLAWPLLPDGVLKSAAFLLATTTWVATLLVNASPFMRFDGYYLLSDWLDLPNLHSRSFALARWQLREWLFDLGEAPPEVFAPRRRRGLILFAWATWLYRLLLFLGIAVLVYHFFIKAVGILLFVVEMLVFVLLPLIQELRAWKERWPAIRRSRRCSTLLLAAAVPGLLCLPLPSFVTVAGLLHAGQQFSVYAPGGARIDELPWTEGATVAAGAVLLKLHAPALELQLSQAHSRIAQLQWQVETAGFSIQQRSRSEVLQQELLSARSTLLQLQKQQQRHEPRAPFAGQLLRLDPDLRAGHWVARHEALAVLVGTAPWQVDCYLNEDEVRLIRAGSHARFHADGGAGPVVALRVLAVDRDATRAMNSGILTLAAGGSVAVREQQGELIPAQALYRVHLQVLQADARWQTQQWRGRVVFDGVWQAPALAYLRAAAAVVRREAGF